MNACLARAIFLFISLVHLPLLEISKPRYQKHSVCLIEFPFKESVSLDIASSLVTTRHSILLALIDIPYYSPIFSSLLSIFYTVVAIVTLK